MSSEYDTCDPDRAALLFVQQYLSEQGYAEALTSLERQTGLLYDSDKLAEGSQLMKLVWRHVEEEMSKRHGDSEDKKFAEEEALLRGGQSDYAQNLGWTLEGQHSANILSVSSCSGNSAVVTSSGDGFVRHITYQGDLVWQAGVGSGGALCAALQPQDTSHVAVGSMDGSLSILRMDAGQLVSTWRPHKKYVVRVQWAPDAEHLVSASWDHTICMHRFAADGDAGCSMVATTLRQVTFPTAVQDICFLQDGHTVVVALRDTNCLHLVDLHDPQVERKVNMNELDDSHVSFYAQRLALSPNGRYLLVATDKPRLILFRVEDWQQVRLFCGLVMEQFHQHCVAWHPGGHYLYAAAAGGHVCVFDVGSTKVVANIAAHPGSNVRDMCYDDRNALLITCSYDKTVKGFTQ